MEIKERIRGGKYNRKYRDIREEDRTGIFKSEIQ